MTLALDGARLSIWWIAPFVDLLLPIAVIPLKYGDVWDASIGKISIFWGLCIVVPMLWYAGIPTTVHTVLDIYLIEYVPFIILLLALFTISVGVRVTGTLKGTPIGNTGMLLVATALASCMGTTGAAILMVRPLLRANAWRQKKAHTFVFFIFLFCKVGCALTPLGDPPLFLGFLQGVGFFWTTTHLWWETLFVVAVLLVAYYALDLSVYRQSDRRLRNEEHERIGVEGKFNLWAMSPLNVDRVDQRRRKGRGGAIALGCWRRAFDANRDSY